MDKNRAVGRCLLELSKSKAPFMQGSCTCMSILCCLSDYYTGFRFMVPGDKTLDSHHKIDINH